MFFKVLNLRKLVWQEFEKDRTGHAREKGPPSPSFALEGVKKTINKSIKAEKEKLKEKMKEKIDVGTFPSEFQSIFFHPWNDTKFWHIFSITSDGS